MSDWKTFFLVGCGATIVSGVCYLSAEYLICPVKDHWAVVGTTGAMGAFLGSKLDYHIKNK